MRNLLTSLATLILLCTGVWATPPSRPWAEPEAPVGCEIVDKVPKDGKVNLLLHVEAGECVESISITWYSWTPYATSDTVTAQQAVNGADSVTFPIVMRIPDSNIIDCNLTVRTLQKKVEMSEPCFRIRNYVDRWGQPHTSKREVSQENELGVRRFAFRITESSVRLINATITGDYEGPSTSDMDIYNIPWLHEAPKTVEEPVSEPHSRPAPPHEPTEEEKREIDSILGITPLTKAQKMAKLEEKPLEGMDRQFFELDGVMYVRDRGEKKFCITKSMTTEELEAWALSHADSSIVIPPETEFEVRTWLTDSAEVAWARRQIDNLKPADEVDCFTARTTLKIIRVMQERGIKLRYREIESEVQPSLDSSRNELDQTDPRSALEALGWEYTELFTESFEGSWPGDWDAWDAYVGTPDYGEDYWGKVGCLSASGYYSCWCNGTGDRTCGYPADGNMMAWLVQTVPIDLSGADDMWVCYDAIVA